MAALRITTLATFAPFSLRFAAGFGAPAPGMGGRAGGFGLFEMFVFMALLALLDV